MRSAGNGTREVRVLGDAASLAETAASLVVEVLRDAVAHRGSATFALAGGSTPRATYERLAAPDWARHLDWSAVHIFFSDERCVGPEDPASNYRMARESLLEPLGLPPHQVHRIEGERGAREAALRYEDVLDAYVGGQPPRLDLILLGMGTDGHTASLFPGAAAVSAPRGWVVATRSPVPPHERVSLSPAILDAAATVVFLVQGSEKAPRVAEVLGRPPSGRLPAALVLPTRGRLLWLLDAAAARLLTPGGEAPARG